MTTEIFGESVALKDQEIDDLLAKLSVEELEELQIELVDPDDPHIPPSARCRYSTDKVASGPFDRQKLLDYLEKKAANEQDWSHHKPYVKETRGKVWKPKEVEKPKEENAEKIALDSAFDEALSQATEEELVDLAAILGFHGMLNQSQYHHAFVSEKQAKDMPGGLQAVTKCEPCKAYDYEPANNTNIYDTTQQVRNNDTTLDSLNFNNINDIPQVVFNDLFEALKNNHYLQSLHLANTGLTDAPVKILIDALKSNKTLKHLNVESNFLSGATIVDLLKAINQNQSIIELKVANQRPEVLGVKNEMDIAKLMRANNTLLKFGACFEVAGARLAVGEALQRNNDRMRKERMSK